jgi:hypothetical protein
LQGLYLRPLGHRIEPQSDSPRLTRQRRWLFAGTLRDGSDGTRTRGLPRDRFSKAPRVCGLVEKA